MLALWMFMYLQLLPALTWLYNSSIQSIFRVLIHYCASSMVCEFLLLLQALTQYVVRRDLRIRVPAVLRSKELGKGSKQCRWFLQGCVLLVESCGEARRIGHCLNCSAVVRTKHHSHLMFMYYYSKTFLHGDC